MIEYGTPIRLGSDDHRRWVGSLVASTPPGHFVTIEEPTRTLQANARFHAMLGDIVKSGYQHFGRDLDIDEWKVLFVTEWMIDTKQQSDIVPTLDGKSFAQLRKSTRKMTGKQISEVMLIVEKYCAEKGIALQLREDAAEQIQAPAKASKGNPITVPEGQT